MQVARIFKNRKWNTEVLGSDPSIVLAEWLKNDYGNLESWALPDKYHKIIDAWKLLDLKAEKNYYKKWVPKKITQNKPHHKLLQRQSTIIFSKSFYSSIKIFFSKFDLYNFVASIPKHPKLSVLYFSINWSQKKFQKTECDILRLVLRIVVFNT